MEPSQAQDAEQKIQVTRESEKVLKIFAVDLVNITLGTITEPRITKIIITVSRSTHPQGLIFTDFFFR